MEEKDSFKFRVAPLTAETYYAWSHDMEAVLRGKGLWKFVTPQATQSDTSTEGPENDQDVDEDRSQKEAQRRDLAFAYILTAVDGSCKSLIRQERCPRVAWAVLRDTFQAVSEAAVDAKLSQLQSVELEKGERIVEYSSRIVGLVGELQCAGHDVSDLEKKRALLRGLPKEYDVTVESVMASSHTYTEAVSRLIVRETRVREKEEISPKALMTRDRETRKCFFCGKPGHFARDCKRKKRESKGGDSGKEKRSCFKCKKVGHLAKDCPETGGNTSEFSKDTAMVSTAIPSALITVPRDSTSKYWMMDSACTKHMANRREYFVDFTPGHGVVQVGNNETIQSYGTGSVRVLGTSNGQRNYVTLHNVAYVPEIMFNLISVSRVRRKGFRIVIDEDECNPNRGKMEMMHKASGEIKMVGFETDEGLFKAALKIAKPEQAHASIATNDHVWHERLGHIGKKVLRESAPHVRGLPDGKLVTPSDCDTCAKSKSQRVPRKTAGEEDRKSSKPLERVFSDVVGPMKNQSMAKSRYFVTLLDECSGYSLIRFVDRKSQVADSVVEMVLELESLFTFKTGKMICINRNNVKWLRTDGGGEYIGDEFKSWLQRRGIIHEVTTAYSPESNGAAERLNRTLLDMARSMMLHLEVPRLELWAEAVNTACFLRNRLVTDSCRYGMTPYEVIHGKRPKLGHVRVFGSRTYVHKQKEARDGKFDSRAVTGILVGFGRGNAYRVLLDDDKRVIETQDVRIVERPMESTKNEGQEEMIEYDLSDTTVIFDDLKAVDPSTDSDRQPNPDSIEPHDGDYRSRMEIEAGVNLEELTYYPYRRRSSRANAGAGVNRYGFEVACVTTDTSGNNDVPLTFDDAMNREDAGKWRAALQSEFDALTKMGTWELVRLPPDRKLIKTKWVFDLKRGARGETLRYKARLVAKGFSQIAGIDFHEVFAPVSKYATVRLIFSVAVVFRWQRRLLDVKNAFINAPLQEEIYVCQPEGFVVTGKEEHVYVLRKALYGLRQASREWSLFLHNFLVQFGFEQSMADPTLYVWKDGKEFVIVVVYVDDIPLFGSSNGAIDKVVEHFKQHFEVRVDEHITKFLGFTIDDNGDSLKMHNSPMIKRLLDHFNMTDCNAAKTPLPDGLDLSLGPQDVVSDATPYRQLIGSLLHLANTVRPDIAFAVGYLSRFMHRPTTQLWKAGKHVLRYLKGTKKLGLVFSSNASRVITAYSDADWGQERPSRKSITGTAIMIGGSLIDWRSKQQSIVAQSTKEAEFIALSFCVRDVLWLLKFKHDVSKVLEVDAVNKMFDVTVGEDNQGCISDVHNANMTDLNKHVDLKYQLLADHIRRGDMQLEYVPSAKMVADIFTKNLQLQKFKGLMALTGMN